MTAPAAGAAVPAPPDPFTPFGYHLEEGSRLYRVCTSGPDRSVEDFNPGYGSGGRFSFFGDPVVPVLYAAETELAAVCETVLHDLPAAGGVVPSSAVDRLVAGRLTVTRRLHLADFSGIGLRRLAVEAEQLTTAPAHAYDRTRRWAAAAHEAGFEGVVWMSKRCNDARAYVLFGDRVGPGDLRIDPSYARLFATGPDRDWLTDVCASVRVEVLAPQPDAGVTTATRQRYV